MKNLLVAFFSLLTLSFANLSFADSDREEIGLTIGGYLSTISLRTRLVYNNVPAKDTSRAYEYHMRRSNSMGLTLLGSYSVLDWLEVEAQATLGVMPKTLFKEVATPSKTADPTQTGTSKMEVNSNLFGTYAVFKFGSEAYVKAKLGLAMNATEYKTSAAKETFSSTGISYGLAAGQKLGPGSVEIMYMVYPAGNVDQDKFNRRFGNGTRNADGSCNNIYKSCSSYSVGRRQNLTVFSLGYVYTF